MEIQRGDIVIVDLEPTKGSEQGKERPAVIVQNDVGNKYAPTTIIAPITSSYDKIYPVNVELLRENTCLEKDSVVLLNQIRTISKEDRISKKIGEVSENKMKKLNEATKVSLGLE